MKMGASAEALKAYEAAHEQDLAIVGVDCPAVGLAGGHVSETEQIIPFILAYPIVQRNIRFCVI